MSLLSQPQSAATAAAAIQNNGKAVVSQAEFTNCSGMYGGAIVLQVSAVLPDSLCLQFWCCMRVTTTVCCHCGRSKGIRDCLFEAAYLVLISTNLPFVLRMLDNI
jgi:hypothetical protein